MERRGTLAYFEAVGPVPPPAPEPPAREECAETAAARRWNEALSTTRGGDIVFYLASLRLDEFHFGLPMQNLELELASSMLGLGAKAPKLAVVSLSSIRRAIDGMPAEIKRQTAIGFLTGVHQSAVIPIDAVLKRALGKECDLDFIVGTDADREIFAPLAARIATESAGLVPPSAIKGFTTALSYRILLSAAGKYHLAHRLDEFIAVYLAGNIPAGFGRDGTLYVLVA